MTAFQMGLIIYGAWMYSPDDSDIEAFAALAWREWKKANPEEIQKKVITAAISPDRA